MSISKRLKRIYSRLSGALLVDKRVISKKLKQIRKIRGRKSDQKILNKLTSMEKRLEASIQKKADRLAKRPRISFPEHLPISSEKDKIIEAIKDNQVLIISGETGSGKSTQIPKMCLEAGRGIEGKIGCTQPRRIAASSIARRIAEELGEDSGNCVGYKIRFKDKTSRDTYIKIMTDGILLAETQSDQYLNEYDTIIIDEAHERSLNIDFLLGILRKLLRKRKNLKLIITSATIDTEKFSKAFDNAPVIEVSGRMYPVKLEYLPIDPELEESGDITYVNMAVKAVEDLWRKRRFGDVLIFMPTEQDILETCELIEARKFMGTTVLPLFGRLSHAEQRRVFSSTTGQKIIVSTNVAETSLTIPGIKYVIDSGLARISQYLPRSRTTSLPIKSISKSSADQRKGRCGRVENGICIRLYSEENYESRPFFTPPEILRSNLADVILRMIALNLGNISKFPFVDMPNFKAVKDGFDTLLELGAIVKKGKRFSLSPKGRLMVRMPIDPKIARMILESQKEGCVKEVAIIASALSIQDPRERPLEKQALADQVHAPFKDSASDFITLLNIWNKYHNTWNTLKTQNKMRKFCKQHFLSFIRMREWRDIHEQIAGILREHKISIQTSSKTGALLYSSIHKSVLSGYLCNIAIKKDKNIYNAARGREVMIFPGSSLFNKAGSWIVSAELVETSRLFARSVAQIEPEWLEELGRGLCKFSYSNPHWEKNRGQVVASEQVSLYGLIIIQKRSVSYSKINPEESNKIFIQSALVEGDIKESFSFLKHNQNLIEKLSTMEDKIRRRDIVADESIMAEFYAEKLKNISDVRTLSKFIKDRGNDDFLKMTEEKLILAHPDEEELSQFPDKMLINEKNFAFSYKFDPGKSDDGITIKIPSNLVPEVPCDALEWLVPGLFKEKVTALIKGLPKKYRKQLVPVPRTVAVIISEMVRPHVPIISALCDFIHKKFGVDIPASAWSPDQIPDHLKMRIAITNYKGKEIKAGRDINILKQQTSSGENPEQEPEVWKEAQKKWEKTKCRSWEFKDIPENISLHTNLAAYPGLEPGEGCVNLRLFKNKDKALEKHKNGIAALFSIYFAKDLKFLKRILILPKELSIITKYFSGPQFIEEALYNSVVNNLFYNNIRTKEAFESHADSVKNTIIPTGEKLLEKTGKILNAYHETRTILYNIENSNMANKLILKLCSRFRKDLDQLVPENFFELYNMKQMMHIPRYLKALNIRAERSVLSYDKEKTRAAQVEPFTTALQEMLKNLSSKASQEKREAMEEFFWMIEEFKVSVFAQELKTAIRISKKRLEKKIGKIERMV
ncbi:ATP-dependent RNA helicase HrpA [Candidatus Magnetomoraceae bacterium gMMP-1]